MIVLNGEKLNIKGVKDAMSSKNMLDDRERLLHIIEKNASVFKYEMTKKHLSEDQIELIYPIIIQFMEKVYREFCTVPKKKT